MQRQHTDPQPDSSASLQPLVFAYTRVPPLAGNTDEQPTVLFPPALVAARTEGPHLVDHTRPQLTVPCVFHNLLVQALGLVTRLHTDPPSDRARLP